MRIRDRLVGLAGEDIDWLIISSISGYSDKPGMLNMEAAEKETRPFLPTNYGMKCFNYLTMITQTLKLLTSFERVSRNFVKVLQTFGLEFQVQNRYTYLYHHV